VRRRTGPISGCSANLDADRLALAGGSDTSAVFARRLGRGGIP
jgi:hypothetical protein